MAKSPEEWLRQADYDMGTAEDMLASRRNVYAIFMCHLSIEKGLKGVYHKRVQDMPARTHNLVSLLTGIGLKPPVEFTEFVGELNELSIVTRYPEDLSAINREYDDSLVREFLNHGKRCPAWIKKEFAQS